MSNSANTYLNLLRLGCGRYKGWLLHTFSIKDNKPFTYDFEKGSIVSDGKSIVLSSGDDKYEATWWKPDTAIFRFKDNIELTKDNVVNVESKITTTYGRALLNQLLLIEHFNDYIKYQNGNWHSDGIIYMVLDIAATDSNITASQAHSFVNAVQYISGLTQLCVPSASEKALRTDPTINKRKKELMEQYKGQLHDPVIVSKIEQELIAIDREWIKGDIAEGFYKSGKAYNITRKKAHIMHGGEKSFLDDTKMTVIPSSLQDGWDMKYMPEMVNSLRDGAYGRGAATSIGGERVKKFQQVFQNSRVSMKDCKSPNGISYHITKENYKFFSGRYLMSGELMSTEIMEKNIGKDIKLRSPQYCRAPKTDFCEICTGQVTSTNPNAISMLAATIGSTFMLIEMAKTHGKELLTVTYEINEHIS